MWDEYKHVKAPIRTIDEAALEDLRRRHTSALISHPRWLAAFAILSVLILAFTRPWEFVLVAMSDSWSAAWGTFRLAPIELRPSHLLENGFLALFIVILIGSTIVVLHRTWICPWHRVAALDLAHMLKRRSYRLWLDRQPRSQQVVEQLRELGVNDLWDSPEYQMRYRTTETGVEPVPIETSHQIVQQALREILGHKEQRQFQPGRYMESLREGKAGVTRFVAAHQEQIDLNKSGQLPLAEGLELLRDLLQNYLQAGTAGQRCVEEAIGTLQRDDLLRENVMEARIWKRDPWVDLTRQTDFFSSASLRGHALKDSLERRSKGVLGPFGYLRNKSISALDLSTRDGRQVRVRMAAAIYPTRAGQRGALLFVDGVEGRFDIKPKLIQRAIEDYARAAGFAAVFYFKHPLNKVPARFVRHVAHSGAAAEAIEIQYVDASSWEYLDAFGYPFEPFEYARPRGTIIGYFVGLGKAIDRVSSIPAAPRIFFNLAKKKYILHAFIAVPLLFVAWTIGRSAPWLLLPMALLVGAMLLYQFYLGRRSIRAARPQMEAEREPFLAQLRMEIETDPTAVKMSYPARVPGKIQKLREYFPEFPSPLVPFVEEVLLNVSVKEGDLTNALKFLVNIKDAAQRERARQVFTFVWPSFSSQSRRDGLSEDKVARDRLKNDLLEKTAAIRELVKSADLRDVSVTQLKQMQTALKMDALSVIKMVAVSPLILRGLRKPPRPWYACAVPLAAGLATAYVASVLYPTLSMLVLYSIAMSLTIAGTYIASTRVKIAPGVLYYPKTREYLHRVMTSDAVPIAVETAMDRLGINPAEFAKEQTYETSSGVRIIVRNKKALSGAVRFLTSSEAIDSCIALQNFVSWTLPSLLADDSVMLADIFYKGSHPRHYHRAQMWMVAAEEAGVPVLTVNSFEFNEEGAKYLDVLMPEAIKVLQDVAHRAGFKKIYVGITEFGRSYLDQHYPQGTTTNKITKVHVDQCGYRYYFDAYTLSHTFAAGSIRRQYVYARRRGPVKRAYAVIFGLIELSKGHHAKARAFFESFSNANNFWEVPVLTDNAC